MSDNDKILAFSHVVLTSAAGSQLFNSRKLRYSSFGVHASLLLHGAVGVLHNQKARFGHDLTAIHNISNESLKYMLLPCVMADLYKSRNNWRILHLFSGITPLTLALTGKGTTVLGNTVIGCNAASLLIYSVMNDSEWGYATVAASCNMYFLAPLLPKPLYPVSLALTGFCVFKLLETAVETVESDSPEAQEEVDTKMSYI